MSDTEARIEAAWQEHLRHEWAQMAEWVEDASFAEFAEWYEDTRSGREHRKLIEAREHFRDITGLVADFLERWVVKPLSRWLEGRMR